MKVFYDKDADLSLICGKKVAIVGYGSQGHAHALNFKDSGVRVTVALREGSNSVPKAKNAGLTVKNIPDAVKDADLVMILAPDEQHKKLYKEQIEPNLKKGATLAVAHGFSIHFGFIQPRADLDVIMIAPKGPGHLAGAPALSRPLSRTSARPIFSASRRCCAGAPRIWCRPASRHWWRRAIRPRWRTSNACMS